MKPKLSYLLFFLMVNFLAISQCDNCNTYVNQLDTNIYSLNAGQTICFDTLSTFGGTIIVNGGTVCNKGLFKPKEIQLISGQIFNYSNISIENTNITIPSGVQITTIDGSVFNLTSALFKISGGILQNGGVLTITGNMENQSGTLNNTGQIHCEQFTGNPPTINTGIINSN